MLWRMCKGEIPKDSRCSQSFMLLGGKRVGSFYVQFIDQIKHIDSIYQYIGKTRAKDRGGE